MNLKRHAAAALLLVLAAGPVGAHAQNMPWAMIHTEAAKAGSGGEAGTGVLVLPNLGSTCAYPFKIEGLGAGIQVDLSGVAAAGPVRNLARPEDFAGSYGTDAGKAADIGDGLPLKNRANNVSMRLLSKATGFNSGFAGQSMTVEMQIPPVDAPRSYVLEFGFNKDHLSLQTRAKLDEIVSAWKCRFVNIKLVGHADAAGRELDNFVMSDKRVMAVRDYLIGAGVFPGRIEPFFAGENYQLVSTDEGVRLRANRAVVVTIEEPPAK